MRCLSEPSETAFTGLRPAPGLSVMGGAQPPMASAARIAGRKRTKPRMGAFREWERNGEHLATVRSSLGFVGQVRRPRRRALQSFVHRFPAGAPWRRLDQAL